VVDKEERLVGIITVDDVVDVIEEKNTEDFERMAAILPSDDDYLHTGVLRMAMNRIPWLVICWR
jgi:magnesium transporter